MSKYRKLAGTLAVVMTIAFGGIAGSAQQTGKIFRIGFLDSSIASGSATLLKTFQQELSKLGWIEGKNFTVEYRFAEGKFDRLPGLAADLVKFKVDLITVSGGPAALAAKKATPKIPIVMTTTGDPIGAGLIASLGQPGRQCHRAVEFSARAK